MTLLPVTSLRAYYGLDAPARVGRLGLSSISFFATLIWLLSNRRFVFERVHFNRNYFVLLSAFLGVNGFSTGVKFFKSIYSSTRSKYIISQRMLELVFDWSRIITVADFGCGRGLLTAAIAKHFSTIRPGNRDPLDSYLISCIGDFEPQTNSNERDIRTEFSKNLQLDGVDLDHIKLIDSSLTSVTLPSNSQDLVVSSLSLHKLCPKIPPIDPFTYPTCSQQQRFALNEIVRICRPGGQILIWDIHCAQFYGEFLSVHPQLTNVFVSPQFTSFGGIPCHIISAKKVSQV